MAAVRSVRAVGTAGVATRWRRDNRPDFPGIAVWVDAVAEIEIDAELFGRGGEHGAEDWAEDRAEDGDEGFGAAGYSGFAAADGLLGPLGPLVSRGPLDSLDDAPDDPHGGPAVPWAVDAWSPDYGKVWRPLSGTGREPRPGLLVSVVRAGVVVACPTPLPDPPTGSLARALARLAGPEPAVVARRPGVLAVAIEPEPPRPRRTASPKAHSEVRVLVGLLVEVLVGRRAAAHAARWADPEVRGKLRAPRYARTTSLKSVRLSESGEGVEALALLQDSGRTRAVALRFDRAEDSRWRCTALQAG